MKAIKTLTLCVILAFLYIFSNAQINVFSGNNVGIGNLTSALSNLSINTSGASSSTVTIVPVNTSVLAGVNVTNISTANSYTGFNCSMSNPGTSVLRCVYAASVCATPSSTGETCGVFGIAGNCADGHNFGI
jgi:hypothetical protein